MSDIFKVQIPVSTNEAEPRALAYTKRRRKDYYVPITDDLLALFPKGGAWDRRYKQFVYARMDGTVFVIDGKAPWQSW